MPIYASLDVNQIKFSFLMFLCSIAAQPAITYSKLTIERPEQGVKYVRS